MTDRVRQLQPRPTSGEGISVRVVTRFYRGDCLPHLYLVGEVDNPAVGFLVLVGHGGLYPDRHPRVELDEDADPSPGAWCDACPRCARWARENEHSVLIRGTVPT